MTRKLKWKNSQQLWWWHILCVHQAQHLSRSDSWIWILRRRKKICVIQSKENFLEERGHLWKVVTTSVKHLSADCALSLISGRQRSATIAWMAATVESHATTSERWTDAEQDNKFVNFLFSWNSISFESHCWLINDYECNNSTQSIVYTLPNI